MTHHEDETITEREIRLDGATILRCRVVCCTLIYEATGEPIRLEDSRFRGCAWLFRGAAAHMVGFLRALAQQDGGPGEVMRLLMSDRVIDSDDEDDDS